jgi:hypothetical protein
MSNYDWGAFFAGAAVGAAVAGIATAIVITRSGSSPRPAGGGALPAKSRWEKGGAGWYAIGYKDKPGPRARVGLIDGPFDNKDKAEMHAGRMEAEGFYGRAKHLSASAAARLYGE